MGSDPKKHACYDIDVEVDDPVRDSMRTYLSPQNTHELEELDGKVNEKTTGNAEEERRADYYTEQWSYEAVSRYFYNKVQQKRAELEQALGIRNA